MHTFHFHLVSSPDVIIVIKATCYRRAINQFCLIFGDCLGSTTDVSQIVKID